MKGYKVFNPDFTCRGHQFAPHTEHQVSGDPELCQNGFHFCIRAVDCFNYYDFKPENIVCAVEAIGPTHTKAGENKACTTHIRIGDQLDWHEVLALVNTGQHNTGLGNTGDQNTGNWNTGDWNTGNRNTGDWNTGNRNTGDWNTGNRNTGDWNTGDRNTGNRNTGDWNTGDWNTGDRNTGNRNTGDWNSTNFSSGIFCTQEQCVPFFNKPSDLTYRDWRGTEAAYLASRIKLTEWVFWADMTPAEKEQHPHAESSDGYLKRHDYKAAHATWWAALTSREKALYPALPNFDAQIFFDITGIDLR